MAEVVKADAIARDIFRAATLVATTNAKAFREVTASSGAITTSLKIPGFLTPRSGTCLTKHSFLTEQLEQLLLTEQRLTEKYPIFLAYKRSPLFFYGFRRTKGFFYGLLVTLYPNMIKPSPRSKWALPFVCGIVLTVAGWVYWQRTHPPLDPMFIQLAKETNSNPYEVSDANALLGETEKGELSDKRWSRLKELFESPSLEVKTTATAAMMGLDRSRHRGEVIAMVKPLLQNPDWRTQNQALILLRRFDDLSWRAEATKRLTSPDERIRSNAQVQFRLADATRRAPSPVANGTSP